MKNIGFDIDGTLTDESLGGKLDKDIWFEEITEYFNLDLEERIKTVYDFRESYGITTAEMLEFLENRAEKIFKRVIPYQNAPKVLNYLKNKRINIFFITARDKEYYKVTKEWFNNHNLYYDKIIHSKNKSKDCLKFNIDLFVDDKLSTIKKIKNNNPKIELLLKNSFHNQENINVKRVNNWREINEIIKKRV